MGIYQGIKEKIQNIMGLIRFHLFETDKVLIYWPDFNKGILLLVFALIILPGHLLWYVCNYYSEHRIWFSESYHEYRLFTTGCQIVLTILVLVISLLFRKYARFRAFMGWFIPLYFGLLLIYSAQSVGIYSLAAVGGTLNILLIGFVFYKPKTIYSIMLIVSAVVFLMSHWTSTGKIPYAPLFSDALNNGQFYKNSFWIQSMAILYLPILFISALFFEILLRQWRRREKSIEYLSRIDGLTQVFNRRYLTELVHQFHRKKIPYAVIILDLDYFKKINDSYGHDAGDEVLKRVALILKSQLRQDDLLGRMGGEEFMMILPKHSITSARQVAERCRTQIESAQIELKNGTQLKITASFGVALYTDAYSVDEISGFADQALYQAKAQGRNQVCEQHA